MPSFTPSMNYGARNILIFTPKVTKPYNAEELEQAIDSYMAKKKKEYDKAKFKYFTRYKEKEKYQEQLHAAINALRDATTPEDIKKRSENLQKKLKQTCYVFGGGFDTCLREHLSRLSTVSFELKDNIVNSGREQKNSAYCNLK